LVVVVHQGIKTNEQRGRNEGFSKKQFYTNLVSKSLLWGTLADQSSLAVAPIQRKGYSPPAVGYNFAVNEFYRKI